MTGGRNLRLFTGGAAKGIPRQGGINIQVFHRRSSKGVTKTGGINLRFATGAEKG